MSEFFSEQLRVFLGAGPPDCPNGAFVYRKIFNIYYDIYLFVSLIFFVYACAYLQFCRHAYAYEFLFCFVIPSSILTIPCYFLSAATCIILPSNYCHYFYYFFPHTRMCASALMQTRTCVSVFFFSLAPILPTSAYVVFFPAWSRFTHTHMRICIRAATHMRMFPYIFPVIRERGLPHVDPVVFFVLCTYFPPCCLERTC